MHVHVNTLARKFWGEGFQGTDVTFKKESVGKFLSVGMRVKVTCGPCNLDGDHSYHGKFIGCTGKIVRIPDIPLTDEPELPVITVGVLIDDKYNERSQYGCYWFKPEELIEIIEEEKENNKMLLFKGYKIAQVAVEGYGEHYVAHYEETLEEGDKVVVAKNEDEYSCGIVINVFVEAHMNCTPKFAIVSKIDDKAHCERIDRAKMAKKLEQQLKTAVAEYQQIALYEMLAEKSPAIAELLKELKEVTGG